MGFVTARKDFDFQPVGSGLIKLQGDLIYQDKKCGVIRVPDGFVCDLASYPRLARPFFDRLGDSMRPAVVHDFLYNQRPTFSYQVRTPKGDTITKQKPVGKANADRIFRQALKEDGSSAPSRWASWLGVAIGGWYAWLT